MQGVRFCWEHGEFLVSFPVTFSDVDSWIHTIVKVVIGPWDTADVRLEDLSAASDGAPVTFVRRKRL